MAAAKHATDAHSHVGYPATPRPVLGCARRNAVLRQVILQEKPTVSAAQLPRFGRACGPRESEFYQTVKDRVDAWFTANGVSRHGDARMAGKVLFWISMAVGSWVLLLRCGLPFPALLPVWMVTGVSIALIGVNVAHDAHHAATSADDRINRLLAWTFDLIGADSRNWVIAHNVLHHTWTNVPKVDPDIEAGPKLRLHAHGPRLPYHRFQQWYAWGMYAMLTLSWVTVSDLSMLRQPHPSTGKRASAAELARFAVGKLAHFVPTLVVPLLVIDEPWWQILVGFVLMHAAAGLTLATTFQLAHVVEGPEMIMPDANGDLENRWAVHQLRTTANFGQDNGWLWLFAGGLHHQIEHHLFPRVCHVHYPAIAPIVAATAAEFGLPYHAHPTVRAALVGHFRRLRELGRPAHG
jgi:linoleoyl-CoA desaturase